MNKYKTIFFPAILFLAFFNISFAESPTPLWGDFGVVVNDAKGNTIQQNSKIAKISPLEYIIAFEDFRSGNADIYIQKVDNDGNKMFAQDGLPVSVSPGEQLFPRIIPDESTNSAFIVWQDDRTGDFDIYFQKIDSLGKAYFEENGRQVCVTQESQVLPEVIPDGFGGMIVSWHDYRNKEEDIYIQRIDASGNLLWQKEGVPVCVEKGTQWFPKMLPDGLGGVFISWADRRNGEFDVYAQHIDANGRPLWAKDGIAVCSVLGNQENIRIAKNGEEGFFVAWSDKRDGGEGVYIQSVSNSGKINFSQEGVKVSSVFAKADIPEISYDGNFGAIVLWSDPYAGDQDIYMQRVSNKGELLWGGEGKSLVKRRGVQESPKIFGEGPFYILWEDFRNLRREVFIQKIDKDGYSFYANEGILIALDQKNAQFLDVALSVDNGIVICYQDDKHGNFDLYAQKINEKGVSLWTPYGKSINDTKGSVIQQNYKAVKDSANNIYFVFEDKREGFSNVYAQKLNSQGKLLWNYNGVAVSKKEFDQINPELIPDNNGGLIVVWEDYRNIVGSKIFAQRLGPKGEQLWGEGIDLTSTVKIFSQKKPKIVQDGKNGGVIVFSDSRGGIDGQNIYAQRIDQKGKLLWGTSGIIISSASGVQDDPCIVPGALVVVWTDYRGGDRNSDIYAQKIDLSGNVLWEQDGLAICEAPDSQRDPTVINDGAGGVIISWTDKGGGSFDIYAQRLDSSGMSLWLKDGVPICQEGRTQQRPQIVLLSKGESVFSWEDFRFGNWDIYLQKMSEHGKSGFGEGGIPVSLSQGTQYSPTISNVSGKIVVAWEDYRNGKSYNIYLQTFNDSGISLFGKDGSLVEETRFGAKSPQIIPVGISQFVLAWEDSRQGGRSIMAQMFKF